MTTEDRSALGIALAAGLLGAGIALLTAPKPGWELRRDLDSAFSRARERMRPEEVERGLNRLLQRVFDRADALLKTGTRVLETNIEAVFAAIDAGRQAYRHEREQIERRGAFMETPATPGPSRIT